MKILLISVFVALATADVSHLVNSGYSAAPSPTSSSFEASGASLLGNYANAGSSLPQYSPSGSSYQFTSYNSPSASLGSFGSLGSSLGSLSGLSVGSVGSIPESSVSVNSVGASPQFGGSSLDLGGLSTPAPALAVQGYQGGVFSSGLPSRIDLSTYQSGAPASLNLGSLSYAPGASQFSSFGDFNGGSQLLSQSSGGSLSESFGNAGSGVDIASLVSGSIGAGAATHTSGKVTFNTVASSGVQTNSKTEVSKHLYFFSGPEEEEIVTKINVPQAPARENNKIIFVKAPSYRNKAIINVPAPPPTKDKTQVFVLVKKPEDESIVNIEQPAPTVPSKPDVFFIKYKTQAEAEAAVAEIQSKQGQGAGSELAGQVSSGLSGSANLAGLSGSANLAGLNQGFSGSAGGLSSSFGGLSQGPAVGLTVSSTPASIDFGSAGGLGSGNFGGFSQGPALGVSYSSTPSSISLDGASGGFSSGLSGSLGELSQGPAVAVTPASISFKGEGLSSNLVGLGALAQPTAASYRSGEYPVGGASFAVQPSISYEISNNLAGAQSPLVGLRSGFEARSEVESELSSSSGSVSQVDEAEKDAKSLVTTTESNETE
ncbi:uncharacterized protein LOC143195651 [Rhynchophorus ferrugineus]|uniref:uncharacterized protein LOC143195651 n=1 Tax=Rhynchophorus ferrugineus TaxID=354439 RepID=UPI003FCDD415